MAELQELQAEVGKWKAKAEEAECAPPAPSTCAKFYMHLKKIKIS
jgi:hypothetical protein